MSLKKIKLIKGKAVYVPGKDVDTDRIIPARFLKCVTFDTLKEGLFYDVRKNDNGSLKIYDGHPHPLDDERFKGATIFLGGENFGCGSSREHAPQAMQKFGFEVVIAESFAEIFFGNSTTIGMPCLCAPAPCIAALASVIANEPSTEVTVDLELMTVSYKNVSFSVSLPPGVQASFTTGRWDPIVDLLKNMPLVHDKMEQLHGWSALGIA